MPKDQRFQNFVGHLGQVIYEHLSWPGDVDNDACEDARQRAEVIARESAAFLWAEMEAGKDTQR